MGKTPQEITVIDGSQPVHRERGIRFSEMAKDGVFVKPLMEPDMDDPGSSKLSTEIELPDLGLPDFRLIIAAAARIVNEFRAIKG